MYAYEPRITIIIIVIIINISVRFRDIIVVWLCNARDDTHILGP